MGDETQRAPPLPSIITSSDSDDYFADHMPPDEAYFVDEEWVS